MAAVKEVGLLGTPAEERFDRITRLAQRMFDMPFACLDIVGEKLAWLKSTQGFDGVEALRKDSYCHHTVLESEYCVVTDARLDPRVFDNAFADTWVFYAGVPLRYHGENIGVLCVGDTNPRDFTMDQLIRLCDLAAMAERELDAATLSKSQIDLAQSCDELDMKARIDALTHLWNRDAILELLETERTGAGAKPLAVLMIEVEQYGHINDSLGRQAGDEVLRTVAQRLRASSRPSDVLGRLAGGRFLAVLLDVGLDTALQTGEQIRNSIQKEAIAFEDHQIAVTCGIGGCLSRIDEAAPVLVRRAEDALLRARMAGGTGLSIEP